MIRTNRILISHRRFRRNSDLKSVFPKSWRGLPGPTEYQVLIAVGEHRFEISVPQILERVPRKIVPKKYSSAYLSGDLGGGGATCVTGGGG